MPTHIVRQGECLSSLAAPCGLSAKDLHDHPANAALKKKRPNPNVLAPGDEVFIPEMNQKSVVAANARTHLFIVTKPKVKLRLALLSANRKPYEGKRFVLVVDTRTLVGKTTAEGLIEVDIPAEAQSAQLRVWLTDGDSEPDIDRELDIGHLDPIDSISGVQARLANLGYPCRVTGEKNTETLLALRRFRERSGLPTGEDPDPDDRRGAEVERKRKGDGDVDVDRSDETHDKRDSDEDEEAIVASSVDRLIDDHLRERLLKAYEETETPAAPKASTQGT